MAGTDGDRAPMVNWYNPVELVQTAVRVAISTVFGEYADRRDTMASGAAALPPTCEPKFNYGSEPGDLWLDYVADTGDGWDSTHAIARLVSMARLEPEGAGPLPRGRVLVFGGDQVYPTASRDDYRQRLQAPFDDAARREKLDPEAQHLFALPGNHDWYDGLSSFIGLFCSKGWRIVCGRRTKQERSYFALRLPGETWLWGVDLQLAGYMDRAQVEYFTHVAREWMKPGSRVILCTGDPAWIYGHTEAHKPASRAHFKNFAFVEGMVRDGGHELCLVLTGDSHHYARYLEGGRNYVTCGGGGAFLHPTHHLPAELTPNEWAKPADRRRLTLATRRDGTGESLFPPRAESRRATWWNLLFWRWNPAFTAGVGLAVAFFVWLLIGNVPPLDTPIAAQSLAAHLHGALDHGLAAAIRAYAMAALATPWPAMAIAAGFAAHYYFADAASGPPAIAVALLHGGAHALAIALCTIAMSGVAQDLALPDFWLIVLTGIVGGLVCSTIFGAYLLVSLNGLGRHWNEAFSSLRIADWKCFLRLRISEDGSITVYPIGLRRVPEAACDDTKAPPLRTELIEPPIEIPRRAPA